MEAIQTFHNQFLFRIDFPEAKFEHHAVKNKDQAERQGYKKESLFFASFFCMWFRERRKRIGVMEWEPGNTDGCVGEKPECRA